jgi:hypothetical protein
MKTIQELLKNVLQLLNQFEYESDEDGGSNSYFKATINEDWFFDVKNQILIQKGIKSEPWKRFLASDQSRIGDHQWYISDLTKFKSDYPEWPGITISLDETILQILDEEIAKLPINA